MMQEKSKKILWLIWGTLSIAAACYFGYKMTLSTDKSLFLIGETSHGHFQIEMACTACHTEPFGGTEVIQDACVNCHGEELAAGDDSHPKKKFTDPRNADRLEILDARYCVSCHTEHKEDQTHKMGVSLPEDYCYHCHQDIGEERETHKDLAFDSCASAGCHNYHDNLALYEAFLLKHADEPWLSKNPTLPALNHAQEQKSLLAFVNNVTVPEKSSQHPDIVKSWSASAHGHSGIECGACHLSDQESWIEQPNITSCQSCHAEEAKEYLESKHGMRLSQNLTPLTPKDSKLEFNDGASHIEHGCNTCHQAHEFNRQTAAVDACLNCHNDEHSVSFWDSPHGQLTKSAMAGDTPFEEAVTCATCHLPRAERNIGEKKTVGIVHNQNTFLRPNEKMIRPVCMQCHGLSFAIDSLADEALILSNFKGKPSQHVPSIEWAKSNSGSKD